MNKNWALGIMLALIGLCALWWLRGYLVSSFVIENQSGQTISGIEIKVTDQTIRHKDIGPGETRMTSFYVSEEAWCMNNELELTGTLSNGTSLRGSGKVQVIANGHVRAVFKIEPGGKVLFSYQ